MRAQEKMFLMPFICSVSILLSSINKNIEEEPEISVKTKPYEGWYIELEKKKKRPFRVSTNTG